MVRKAGFDMPACVSLIGRIRGYGDRLCHDCLGGKSCGHKEMAE